MAQWVKNPPAMQETQEMRVGYLGWEDPLEEEMAAHSSILAWKIPWTEKLDMGLQRVECDWAINTYLLYLDIEYRVGMEHVWENLLVEKYMN